MFTCIQGKVKVVRSQTIVDVQNDTKFVNQSTEELGCARPYSHADGMSVFTWHILQSVGDSLVDARTIRTIIGDEVQIHMQTLGHRQSP